MISHALPIQIGIFTFASSVRTTFKPIQQGSNQVNMTKNLNLARKHYRQPLFCNYLVGMLQ
jgi:hypothetical protein